MEGLETRIKIREDLEEFLYHDTNKISKAAALYILRRFRRLEALYVDTELKRIKAEATLRGIMLTKSAEEKRTLS